MIFILKSKLQKDHFFLQNVTASAGIYVHFELQSEWEFVYLCHDFWLEKEGIYDKKSEYKANSGHKVTFILEINLQK